jgi:beta-glucuronidase
VRHFVLAALLSVALAGVAPAAPLQAAPAPAPDAVANVGGRRTTSLDGMWRTIVDPYANGFGSKFYENRKPKDESELIEYDFDTSPTLAVPGDWNTQRESLFLYEGVLWYEKTFDARPAAEARQFVYFGAANYAATVYLNGEKLGEHEGGFTPFSFEVTGKLRPTGNFLVVAVDSTRRQNGVPTLSTDWWNYGGITRNVSLVEVPRVFVRDYFVQLAKGSRDRVAGWVRVDGATGPQRVTVRVPEAHAEQTVETDAAGYAPLGFDAKLELWSPERPKLYDVEIACGAETLRDQIGFRSIETRGTEILLNGAPVFLRGICIHEEAPGRARRATTTEDAEVLLGWAKELGCNFVRLAHYPHNEAMVRAADRLGLLVWSEVPVYWSIAWEDPHAFATAQSQLGEMIARDHNRAAVIIWSIGNETPQSDARLKFMQALAERARSLDATRLLAAAMFVSHVTPTTLRIDDPLGRSLDVFGCNEYVGWYDGLPSKADTLDWQNAYDKPLIMSEFGGGAQYGRHGGEMSRFSEEYQAGLYEHQLRMLDRIPFLRGTTPWILKDFRSPRRQLPGVQDFFNRKGLVSDAGQRKLAFYVLQRYYRQRAAAAAK